MSHHPKTSPDLPQREDAARCASTESQRRCVLPPDHMGSHVYPPEVDDTRS
jgi:hypothetical protein